MDISIPADRAYRTSMSGQTTATLLAVLAVLALVVWFDRRCLADLAATSDYELRYVSRTGWALIIILSFPIGPMLYLALAKTRR
jgi:hypothetical protein